MDWNVDNVVVCDVIRGGVFKGNVFLLEVVVVFILDEKFAWMDLVLVGVLIWFLGIKFFSFLVGFWISVLISWIVYFVDFVLFLMRK